MKILLSWLREFVAVPDSPAELARQMSLHGFAVESLEALDDGDAVLDFEVTANRPDCMSVTGIAREVATAYALPLLTPGVPGDRGGAPVARPQAPDPLLDVSIDTPEWCSRYVGAVADVSVGSSPAWLQSRLQAAGVRPISNIVDVTNYVLLETGQPMHAFDRSRLAGGGIRVRAARPGETLQTLDGQLRQLSPDMLVIADAERPVALAGVMGGAASEVRAATTSIVLESAHFDPRAVRRTSRSLGLKTEASMRFERGTDPALPPHGMARALALLFSIGAGAGRGAIVDAHPVRSAPRVLHLRRARLVGTLGAAIPDGDVHRILEALGFAADAAGDGWTVTVPTRRVDILREADLIEEVARHYGFDRLPATFPALASAPPPIDPRILQARRLRGLLTGAGFFEAVTFGFIAEAAAAPFAAREDLVPIANPLSENFAVLRPSLLPGLVSAVAHNRRREQRDIRLFEIGATFTRAGGERRAAACVWTGAAAPEHWSQSGRLVDFFDVKAVAERICADAAVHAAPSEDPWLVAGRRAAVLVDSRRVGAIGLLDPRLAVTYGIPASDDVFIAEVDLDALEAGARAGTFRVQPLPKYPSAARDISVLIDDSLPAADVRRTISDAAPATLASVTEFDRYQGAGIPERKISLSLRLTFRSSDRTLTDAEVQAAMERIVNALAHRHGAVQR